MSKKQGSGKQSADNNIDDDGFGGSGSRRRSYSGSTFTISLGLSKFNHPNLSYTRINGLIDRIDSKTNKTAADYEELISLQAVARKSYDKIWSDSQKLAALLRTGEDIADRTKLDLGIAA
ncbi:MAG: hypothetical protein OYH77_05255, partial [Pseudomonadota bacterium]|nr:hypothetical protein [Pseudomonadota bacterium]